MSRQLATSCENLVASTQFLVALATSESQFRALLVVVVNDAIMNMAHSYYFSFVLYIEMDFLLDKVELYQKYIVLHHYWQTTG